MRFDGALLFQRFEGLVQALVSRIGGFGLKELRLLGRWGIWLAVRTCNLLSFVRFVALLGLCRHWSPLRSLLVPSVECVMWVLILSPLGLCEGFWKLKPCAVSRVGMETAKEIRQKWAVNRVNTISSPGFELALAHGENFEFQWIRILGSIILRHLGKLYAIEWVISGQYMEKL